MNLRKTIFVCGGSLIILLLLAVRLGWLGKKQKPVEQEVKTVQKQVPVKTTASRKPVKPAMKAAVLPLPAASERTKQQKKRETPAFSKEEQSLGVGDPFVYAGTGSGDYTPLAGNKNVGNITVRGIICIEGEKPRAILYLKESGRVHYVSKDSVVRVSTGGKKSGTPAEAYIVVKDIRNDEVELIQLERPDKVIIIR